ncbi:MAG: hypothetical protein LBD21_09015 [Tannerellaceae bacterium]|jgi:hypothetical protein|nr:hypothetical protein [Tannerellaceae bacterium]
MKIKLLLSATLCALTIACLGQQSTSWERWTSLIGEWKGEGSGQPGQGGGTFSFSFELDKNIIVRKSHSEYPATDNKPKVIHEDLMIIYPDSNEQPAKAIYFDNEGHIIHYSISYAEQSITLISDKVANLPIFRLTYTLLSKDIVNTEFEMSQDGEQFFTYIEGKSIKTK